MKHRLVYSLMAIIISGIFSACNDDNDPTGGKIIVPSEQPTSITAAANETEGQITVKSDVSISAWVSDRKGGLASTDIEWIQVDQPHKDDGRWFISYTLQINTTGASRSAYIVVAAEDEKVSFAITQTDEEYDIPSTSTGGQITIISEKYEDYIGSGTYRSDGEHLYEIRFSADAPSVMQSIWTDEMENGPGQSGDTECLNEQTTQFFFNSTGLSAKVTDLMRYRPSGRIEYMDISEHSMNFIGYDRIAKDGSYKWADENETIRWQATYDDARHIVEMRNNDDGENWVYRFTWSAGLLTKIVEVGSGNTVTFSYANPSAVNQFKTFDLNWILPEELETLDFAAGDVTKIWASFGYLGTPSTLLATEISEYRKNDNVTYTYRMNYELVNRSQIRVNAAHLVNGVQDSYTNWDFNLINIH